MKLTKLEQMLQSLLIAANKPVSRRDLEDACPYRFVPSAVILLSLEALQRKGMVREVGVSRLGCCEEERLYAVNPPAAVKKDRGSL